MSLHNRPPPAGKSILVVEGDEAFAIRLAKAFETRGYLAQVVHDFDTAVAAVAISRPDFALVDLQLRNGSALQLVKRLHSIAKQTHVIVLTDFDSIATANEAIELGARCYLTKPATTDEILTALGRADSELPGADPAQGALLPDRVPWEQIQRVLTEHQGNISRSARALGIHRRTLQRRLNKHPVRS